MTKSIFKQLGYISVLDPSCSYAHGEPVDSDHSPSQPSMRVMRYALDCQLHAQSGITVLTITTQPGTSS